jgi:hypothetical protein
MAQWLGQFTGKTHRTAVEDAEALVRHAASVFRKAVEAERPKKAKAVRALAKRLHAARLRFLRAQIRGASDHAITNVLTGHAQDLRKLEQAITVAEAEGVDGILREFLVEDAVQGG